MSSKKNKPLGALSEEYLSYIEHSKRLSKETIRGERQTFETFNKLLPEVKLVSDLTTENMDKFFRFLNTRKRKVGHTYKTGVKISTTDTYYRRLSRFFNWLVIKGEIIENPLGKITRKQPVYDDDRTLKKSEIEKIIVAIDMAKQDPMTRKRDKSMIYTLLCLGIRKGELAGLQVRDINFNNNTITIRGETSKSKFARRLPIHYVLREHLEDYLNERRKKNYTTQYLWVSTSKDEGLTKHGIKHFVEKLKTRSGVHFHLHQFRHTFAVALARENTNMMKIMRLMGHKSLKMTSQYLRSIGLADYQDDISKISLEKLI